MEIEQLRKEINEILENVVEHSENYSGNRQIPSLEISFVLSKINKMQEYLIILKHLLQENERKIKQQKKLEKVQAKIIEEEIFVEPIIEKTAVIEKEFLEKVPEPIVETKQTENKSSNKNFEKLSIPKLMDALTLNDRYLYANELFNKNMNAFNELVKSIDNCNSFEEAKSLVTKMETQLEWDNENKHVLSFINLVERRFL